MASLPSFSSKKPPTLWLHGLAVALPLALIMPAMAGLETPLPDGTYRAERGYRHVNDSCPRSVDIPVVRISKGTISFESGESNWAGTINEQTGVVRIETAGIAPRPNAALHIRGHYTKAQLFSAICGAGHFRIYR
ncbi:MAG: hypothetical protein K2P86_03900 [Xanthobacteraceae bacterium]|nr:hypothetical protein [Xanthobacteraceae bacterium]